MRGEARHSRGAALSTVTKRLVCVYTCGSDERRAQTAALQTEFSYNHVMYKTQSGTTDLLTSSSEPQIIIFPLGQSKHDLEKNEEKRKERQVQSENGKSHLRTYQKSQDNL